MNVFFQVNDFGVTYVTEDERVLKSQSRPPMSFDYEILTYSKDEKTVYKNLSKRDLTANEIEEVEAYLATIEEDPELTRKMAKNMQAKHYLSNTDWYVIRQIETGAPIPETILENRRLARTHIE